MLIINTSLFAGTMNAETVEMMQMPRCGVKDIEDNKKDMTKRRKRRYALQGSMWSYDTITWRINKFTPDLDDADVLSEVERAFKVSKRKFLTVLQAFISSKAQD